MTYARAALTMPRWGRLDYQANKSLSDNPGTPNTYVARLWADGWLKAWLDTGHMNSQPANA
jgi:hypothetical protein